MVDTENLFAAPVSNNLQCLMLMTIEKRRKQTAASFDYNKFSRGGHFPLMSYSGKGAGMRCCGVPGSESYKLREYD